mgnify:CR=1 FL=1
MASRMAQAMTESTIAVCNQKLDLYASQSNANTAPPSSGTSRDSMP